MTTSKNVLLKTRAQMPRKSLQGCHDGNGVLDWVGVLGSDDLEGRRLNFLHDDVLPPGVSIGLHKHSADEEYYYIVSGQGVMTLDDKCFEVSAGDVTGVFPGGAHALENTGAEDLRVIVISLSV